MLPEKKSNNRPEVFDKPWFKEIYDACKEKQQAKQVPLPPPQQEQEDDTDGDNGYRSFAENIYRHLPELLRVPTARFTDGEERELFLVGALGIISGMLPNYTGNYFGNDVGPNLYCFIIGRYGTGKGALKWARMLAEETHRHRLEAAKQSAEQYRRDKIHYNMQLAQYNKGKLGDPPEEPRPPRHLKLFIPANTTKTAVMQLLEENDGNGIIFETEGDTLADMLRQDYGNFSDILRKAYHHESVSFFRRANNEDVSVEHPALSVTLSGTYDQLLKLIPSVDNGLFSRFMFYILQGNDEFRNPFEQGDSRHGECMQEYGSKLAALYRLLSASGRHWQFVLTQEQQERFVERFKYIKEWTQEHVSEDMDGAVNRMALMAYRIAMIFALLRQYEQDPQLSNTTIVATNPDIYSAVDIMDVLGYNANDVYEYLGKHGIKRAANQIGKDVTDDQRTLCYRYHQQGMSLRKIAAEVFGSANAKNRVTRILKDYGKME